MSAEIKAIWEILIAAIAEIDSAVDIHFWISDDVTSNGLWAPQRKINIHIVFTALTFKPLVSIP